MQIFLNKRSEQFVWEKSKGGCCLGFLNKYLGYFSLD